MSLKESEAKENVDGYNKRCQINERKRSEVSDSF